MAKEGMNRISKEEYFMKIAEVVSQRSTCIKRKVGAVLVKDSHIISTGYNGAPPGFKHCSLESCVRQNLKPGERPELCRGVHAEINCVSEDTLLISTNGEIIEAKDFNNKLFAINENLKVVTSEGRKFKSIKDKLIKINTVGNFELLVSDDNLMFVMDDQFGLKIKKACELTFDDYLPIITFIPINGKPQKLPTIEYDSYKLTEEGIIRFKQLLRDKNLSQNKLAQKMKSTRMVIQRFLKGEGIKKANFSEIENILGTNLKNCIIGVERKSINIPEITSKNLCQIIGYFIGDGTIGENFIKFYDKNRTILEYYNELIQKVFKIRGNISKNQFERQYILTISSKRLQLFFEKLDFGIGEKKIPLKFQRVDNNSLSFLLRGLFDAEGIVRLHPRKSIGLTSGFKKILEVVRLLLLRFGILSSIYQLKRTVKISNGAKDYCYILTITGEDLLKFKEVIGFSHPVKKQKIDKIKNVGLSKRRSLPKFYFTSRISTTNYSTLRDRRSNLISQNTANIIVQNLKSSNIDKKTLLDLTKLTNSHISFVKIKDLSIIKRQSKICLKLIVNAGIKRLVYKEGYDMENKVKEELIQESNLIIEKFQ